jgi:hypothetical protein
MGPEWDRKIFLTVRAWIKDRSLLIRVVMQLIRIMRVLVLFKLSAGTNPSIRGRSAEAIGCLAVLWCHAHLQPAGVPAHHDEPSALAHHREGSAGYQISIGD